MVHHTLICHSYITIKRCLSYNVFPILFFLAHTNAISTLKAKFKSAFILQVHLVASSLNFNVGPNAFKSKIAHVLAILDRCCFCVFAVFRPLDGIFLRHHWGDCKFHPIGDACDHLACQACHDCSMREMGNLLFKIISEDQWHSHLFPSVGSGTVSVCLNTVL